MAGDKPEVLVTFEFHNLEAELSAHVSFGLHPGFAVASLPEAQVILPREDLSAPCSRRGISSRARRSADCASWRADAISARRICRAPSSCELADVPEAIFAVEDPVRPPQRRNWIFTRLALCHHLERRPRLRVRGALLGPARSRAATAFRGKRGHPGNPAGRDA